MNRNKRIHAVRKTKYLTPETEKELVTQLREHSMTRGDIRKYVQKHHPEFQENNMTAFLNYLDGKYPLYEPSAFYYKILTDKDIEEYRKQEERRKVYGRNVMA